MYNAQVYEDTPFWEMPPAEEYVTRQSTTYMVQHNDKGEQIMVPVQGMWSKSFITQNTALY